jgi:hypothetical protein
MSACGAKRQFQNAVNRYYLIFLYLELAKHVRYAVADIAWFLNDGDAMKIAAWQRSTNQYLPNSKAGLYPPVLAEGVAPAEQKVILKDGAFELSFRPRLQSEVRRVAITYNGSLPHSGCNR